MGEYVFKFPDVAEGLTEGKLLGWKVKEGDAIKEDDVVCEMETDKSVLEITCPKHGTVKKLHHKEGDTVPVGEALITLELDGGSGAESDESSKEEQPAAPKEAPAETEGKPETPTESSQEEPKGESTPSQEKEESPDKPPEAATAKPPPTQSDSADVKILPKDRKLAEEKGVDLLSIKGTGRDGRITEQDIAQASGGKVEKKEEGFKPHITETVKVRAPPSVRKKARELGVSPEELMGIGKAAPAKDSGAQPAPQVKLPSVAAQEGDEREEIKGIREKIRDKMADAWHYVPHANITFDVPVDKLIKLRAEHKEEMKKEGISLTYLAFIAKVVAAALEKYPRLNSALDESTNEIVYHKKINLGIAVDTEHGLIVPNIKDADTKSITEIAKEITELAQKARDKKISPKDITQGTFTITNLGSFGATTGFSIVNYPEAAILTVGRMYERLKDIDGRIGKERIMPLTLAIDHRVLDGADAGRFMQFLAENLSDPENLLLEVL